MRKVVEMKIGEVESVNKNLGGDTLFGMKILYYFHAHGCPYGS